VNLLQKITGHRKSLGAAAIGGAAGWLLALGLVPDLLAEVGRMLLVYGIGGGLAGLGMLAHYRRNVAPVIGSKAAAAVAALSGLAFLVASVYASAWIFALTAGAQTMLADLVVIAMVAVGALFLFVALSSAAALPLAILRRRRRMEVDPKQIRTLAAGAMLVLMIVGSPLLVPELGLGLYAYTVSGFPVHFSWYERDRELFAGLLEGARCDVLVVPVEARGASLDRPGRDLITRSLAAKVADRTGGCVADTELVWRALGRNRREFAADEVHDLAQRLDARWLVRGEASLQDGGRTYRLEITAYERGGGEQPWQKLGQVRVERIGFDDENSPEQGVLGLVDAWPDQLGLPIRPDLAASPRPPSPRRTLPDIPEGLLEDTGAAVDRAERLQLLAAMLPPEHTETEALWARSLVALRELPPSDPAARVLAARANLHLYRRPYAERLLAGLTSSEARVLHAIVRGDLKLAKERVDAVDSPIARLISQLEVEGLRGRFGDTSGFEDRRARLLREHPDYASLLYNALSSGEWWFSDQVYSLAGALVVRGVGLEEPWWRALLRHRPPGIPGRIAAIVANIFFPDDVAYVSGMIERSYAPLWRSRAPAWRQPAHDRLQERDLFEALFVLNRSTLVQELGVRGSRQGLPVKALREIGRVDPALRSHPLTVTQSARVVGALWDSMPAAMKDFVWQVSARLGTGIARAEKTESALTERIAYILPRVRENPLIPDQPMRDWRAAEMWGRPAGNASDSPNARESAAAMQLRALRLTQTGFEYLESAHEMLIKLGRSEDARRLLAENEDRFRGNPERESFDIAMAERWGDINRQIAVLKDRVVREPGEWEASFRLASALLRARRPYEAEKVLTSFAGFRDPGVDRVVSANNAREGAWLLYWNGEPVLARALAETAMSCRTGAGAEMAAARYIAHMGRDYRKAMEWEELRNQRYPSDIARANIAYYAFLLGQDSKGWAALQEASELARDGRSLFAVHAGLRKTNADRDQTAAYIERWRVGSRRPDTDAWTRATLALTALTMDRNPDESDLAIIRRFGGATADRSLQLFGEGYYSFRRGDYGAAVEPLAKVYAMTLARSTPGRKSFAYPLPYLTYALARSGSMDEAKMLLERFSEQVERDNFFWMARAMVDGLEGRHERALEGLWYAFVDPPPQGNFAIPPLYQVLEAAEELHRATQDERYRALLADMATRVRIAWPFAWAYAFEARYARNPESRRAAIAAAMYLDPRSARLQGVSPKDREEARALLAKAPPFRPR